MDNLNMEKVSVKVILKILID